MTKYKVINKDHVLYGYVGELEQTMGSLPLHILKFPNGSTRGFTIDEITLESMEELHLEKKYWIAVNALKNVAMWQEKYANEEAEKTLRLLNEII